MLDKPRSLMNYLLRYAWLLIFIFALSIMISILTFENYYHSKVSSDFCSSTFKAVIWSLNNWVEVFNTFYKLDFYFLKEALDRIYLFFEMKPNATDEQIHEELSKIFEENMESANWYLINPLGIIERTDYATDIGVDLSKKAHYWKRLTSLKASEKHFDPITYEVRTGKPRFYSYIKLANGYLFELGFSIPAEQFNKLLELLQNLKRQFVFMKDISIYSQSLAPILPTFKITEKDREYFSQLDGQSFAIRSNGRWEHVIYGRWIPSGFPIGFDIKIDLDLSILSGFKTQSLWILNFTILVIVIVSVVIIYLGTKKINYLIDEVVNHISGSSHSSRRTGVREIDLLIDKYDELVKELNEQLRLKDEFARILSQNIEERDRLQQELEKLVMIDELTGVYNRRAAISFLSDYLKNTVSKLSVCYFDVDHLKMVNDNLGHLCGDELLKHVTNVVKEHLRRTDFVARFGGDEFLIIFPQTSKEQAQFVMDRIIQNLQRSRPECLKNLEVSISYGLIEVNPGENTDVDQIIMVVDEKMYQHKKRKAGDNPPLKF